ncbi:MAG: DUF2188 domain-containing protein [Rhodospirillales bacterium]|nr:MAG: DUF2188 domain-containing protein [Rhodospirillales bacterium]
MDLVTLIAVCSIGVFDRALTEGLILTASHGEPWAYRVVGEDRPRVFASADEAVAEARKAQHNGVAIRIGLAAIETDLEAATAQPNAAMFAPCVNIGIATRRLDQLAQRCGQMGRHPETCALAVYWGSWQQPDQAFAEAVVIEAAKPRERRLVVEDFGQGAVPAGDGDTRSGLTAAVPPAESEAERQRREYREGGGGLFPEPAHQDAVEESEPERRMIFEAGRGFGAATQEP